VVRVLRQAERREANDAEQAVRVKCPGKMHLLRGGFSDAPQLKPWRHHWAGVPLRCALRTPTTHRLLHDAARSQESMYKEL
jgi:hypothetical protein